MTSEDALYARAALACARQLQQTEMGRADLADCQRLLEDESQRDYVAAVGQPYDGWTVGQIAALGGVHALACADLVDVACIPVGQAPDPDGCPDVNRLRLKQLPDCFTLRLNTDGTGVLNWQQSVADRLPCGWTSSAPALVGYTDASRTFQQLADHGAVVRWPHHSADLWLFSFVSFPAWANWSKEADG